MSSRIKRLVKQWPILFLGKQRPHKFSVGETVRVKGKEVILDLIGPAMKTEGCLFMDQMWDYCGGTFRVSKVVGIIYNEQKREHFRPRSSMYILDGLTCKGNASHFRFNCDRGCPILWHEDWLDKL